MSPPPFLNSSTNWDSSIQIYEFMAAILLTKRTIAGEVNGFRRIPISNALINGHVIKLMSNVFVPTDPCFSPHPSCSENLLIEALKA